MKGLGRLTGEFLDEVFRFFSRNGSGVGFAGDIPSKEFFAAVKAGDKGALHELSQLGYGDFSGGNKLYNRIPEAVEREISSGPVYRGMSRFRRPPRTIFTHPIYAKNRAFSNLSPKFLAFGFGIGALQTAMSVASAPRGEVINEVSKGVGETVGGILGAAVGALGGLPGELVGGIVGANIGRKVGGITDPLMAAGRNIGHANFGGNYHDSERAYTFRQQAVQSMNSSILSARQFLGKEALLFHS